MADKISIHLPAEILASRSRWDDLEIDSLVGTSSLSCQYPTLNKAGIVTVIGQKSKLKIELTNLDKN